MGELDTVAGLREAAGLFARIWETPTVPPRPHDVLRALVHAGGRVDAAFRDGHLVGAAVAVFSAPADAACYSLIAGVSPGAESRGIGLALKLAQRAWALRAGVRQMVWTFDPLLRRNAWFNVARLGAVGTDYLVDFYGEITDGVNDPETDRLPGRASHRRSWSRDRAMSPSRRPCQRRAPGSNAGSPAISSPSGAPTRAWPAVGGSRSARPSAA